MSYILYIYQGLLDGAWGAGTGWFRFAPFRACYNIIHFPEMMMKPLVVHKVWADLGVCFLFQTCVCMQLVTFCFLTPPFAEHACHLPRSPENRMEAHKSLTCFRWPYKSCMSCLINPARLLWLRNGEALPQRAVGARGGGGPQPLLSGPQLLNSFPNHLFTSAHVSRAVSQRGELLALEYCLGRVFLSENNMALSGN